MAVTQLQWFDSHCHFDFKEFNYSRENEWQFAQKNGLVGLIIPGISRVQGATLPAFCAQKPWFYAQGLHPYFMDAHTPNDLMWLEQELKTDAHIIAVGEIGLDAVIATTEDLRKQQWNFFSAQVALALSHKKPLIVHMRGMHDEACAYLRKQQFNYGGIVHAFSGSEQQAKAWLNLGFSLGIGGAMSHSRATRLRKTIQALPTNAWLLETDSPDMKPAFWVGEHNSPAAISMLAALLASLKRLSLTELAAIQQHTLLAHFPMLQACFSADQAI